MFSFSINQSVDFSNFSFVAHTALGREWLSTMYENAVKGAITGGDIDAYAYGCEINTQRTLANKQVPFINESELKAGFKGKLVDTFTGDDIDVTAHTDLERMSFTFEAYEEEAYYRNALSQLEDMRPVIFNDLHIDIAYALINGLNNIKKGIENIKQVLSQYDYLGEVITTVLSHKDSRYDIQRMVDTPVLLDLNA